MQVVKIMAKPASPRLPCHGRKPVGSLVELPMGMRRLAGLRHLDRAFPTICTALKPRHTGIAQQAVLISITVSAQQCEATSLPCLTCRHHISTQHTSSIAVRTIHQTSLSDGLHHKRRAIVYYLSAAKSHHQQNTHHIIPDTCHPQAARQAVA
jgi:hypothetical protein